MKKTINMKRWLAVLLAVVLALPVFAAGPAAASGPDGGPAASELNYFGARYPALAGEDHVFETVTYYELDYLLRNGDPDGNYIILFGGSWQDEVQQAIGYINEVAKEYGVTSIKNFDTRLAGPETGLDIARSDGDYGDFSRRYVDLGFRYLTNLNDHTPAEDPDTPRETLSFTYTVDGSPVTPEVNVVKAPFLFIYNKNNTENGDPAPIVASLEGIDALTGSGADAYRNALRAVFDTISDDGTTNAHYSVLTNQEYVTGSYNEYKGASEPAIFDEHDPPIVLDSVTLDELNYVLSTDGTYAVIIGCAWCGNTRAAIKYVNEIANEYGIDKVYNWDTKLDGGIGSSPTSAANTRPAWGDNSGSNYLQTRDNNKPITHIYTDWINTYLPNLISQNSQAASPTRISGTNPITGDPVLAERLQAPYVFVYDKRNNKLNDQDEEVWNPILGHVELMLSWTVSGGNAWRGTSDRDGSPAQFYMNSLRTLFSRLEWRPSGLTGVTPSTENGADGKITGIAKKSLEYRLQGEEQFQAVPADGNEIVGLTAGVYEFRYAAKNGYDSVVFANANQSVAATARLYAAGLEIVEVVVPNFRTAPTGLYGQAVTTIANDDGQIVARDSEGVLTDIPAGLEYKLAAQDESFYAPASGSAIEGLASGEYHVRYAATDSYAASAPATVYIAGYNELEPPVGLGVVHPTSLANNDGQITGLPEDAVYQLEYKKGNDDYVFVPDEAVAAGAITGLTPDAYSVRFAVYGEYSPSIPVVLVIKAFVAAPEGLGTVRPTSNAQNDGKITGTTTALEYRASGDSTYYPVEGAEITGLEPGNYYVRYAETDSALASADTEVTVARYRVPFTGNTGNEGGDNDDGAGNGEPASVEGIEQSGDKTVATVAAQRDEETGAAIALVTPELVNGLLSTVRQAATEGKKASLEIVLEDSDQTGNIQVTLPRESFDELVATESDFEVTINVGFGSLVFDAAALKAIGASEDAGNISFILNKTELTDEGKEVLGDRPVYNLLVYAGLTNVSSFGGSEVSVSLPYTLEPDEDANAIIIYHVTDEGELHLIKGRYNAATGAAEFTTTHFSQYIIGYNKIDFVDVAPAAWYTDAITYLAARDITSGTGDDLFSPDAPITRGQFIVLLLNAYGIEPDDEGGANFADAGDTYYTGHLAAAKRLGIASGYEGNLFKPGAHISRQELFALLYRVLQVLEQLPAEQADTSSLSGFADEADIPGYAREAFAALVAADVIAGADGKLLPGDASSRAEVAQVLYRLLSR